jgi:hypothetical protein
MFLYQKSILIDGVAFKKTFSYAGFEQQPKYIPNAKVMLLNIELELKAEKENAEVRIENPDVGLDVLFYFDSHYIYIFFLLKGISSHC